ncbi:hypothetical protein PG985_012758 [Apiospora marii]|uniref:Uncharacterized protein n=1 Tax=Apiospora marii TaxID=335849 RepID=A0ABR1RCB7_9PEZI
MADKSNSPDNIKSVFTDKDLNVIKARKRFGEMKSSYAASAKDEPLTQPIAKHRRRGGERAGPSRADDKKGEDPAIEVVRDKDPEQGSI